MVTSRVLYAASLVLIALAFLAGCGGEDRCSEPVLWLSVSPDSATLEPGETLMLRATVCAVCDSGVVWYVDHVRGGNDLHGTITQTNPAVYKAPDRLPHEKTVNIMAVAAGDAGIADGCRIGLKFTVVHVDVAAGDDTDGTGAVTSPVKTITRGLQLARIGMKVFVAEGLYSTESGEIFPLVVGDGVSLVGEDWETTRIKGGSSGSGDADVAVSIAGNECKFESFEVSGDSAVTELKIVGTAAGARISSIRLPRVDTVGVRVGACTDVCIDSCYAVNPYKCYCGAGIRFEGGDTGTVVRGCRLTDFSRAIEFAGSSDACVEGCDLDGNAYGIYLLDTGDPEGGPNPDLGGGARACPGGNILSCGCGLMNLTPNTIYARSNTWNHYPPVEGEEFRNLGGGQVIW